MLLCECLSVLAGHCVVWLSDSHSLKVGLFVSNLFATPASRGPRLQEGTGQAEGHHWYTIGAGEGHGRLASNGGIVRGLQGMPSPSCPVLILQTPAAC